MERCFSVKGISIAIDYWKNKGHNVVGIIPGYILDKRRDKRVKALSKQGRYMKSYKVKLIFK